MFFKEENEGCWLLQSFCSQYSQYVASTNTPLTFRNFFIVHLLVNAFQERKHVKIVNHLGRCDKFAYQLLSRHLIDVLAKNYDGLLESFSRVLIVHSAALCSLAMPSIIHSYVLRHAMHDWGLWEICDQGIGTVPYSSLCRTELLARHSVYLIIRWYHYLCNTILRILPPDIHSISPLAWKRPMCSWIFGP